MINKNCVSITFTFFLLLSDFHLASVDWGFASGGMPYMIFRFIMNLSLVLFAHGDACPQPCGQTSFFQREMVMLAESLDKTPLHEGLSNRDERDEGKEEGKRREVAINCQGGAVDFMFVSRPLPVATAPCRSPKLCHPLPRAWVAFVRIRQMAPPVSRAEREGVAAANEVLAASAWHVQSRIEFRRRII